MTINEFPLKAAPLPGYLDKIFVCPSCRGHLIAEGSDFSCADKNCGKQYRTVGHIPVLTDEAASAISFDSEGASLNKSHWKSLALRYLPSLDKNVVPTEVKAHLIREILALNEQPIVLNIGGKHPTSLTDQICELENVNAIECDLAYRARTGVFANPERIPLRDGSVDCVLLDALLEHVPNPQEVVNEAWRVLKPNGIIFSDTPFMVQVHGGAFDYMRFSHQAHRWLFRNFDELGSGVSSGPGVALAYAIQYFFLSFAAGQRSRYVIKTSCRLTLFWLKYFDRFLSTKPSALDAAHGLYFFGRRADTAITERELVERYDGSVPPLYPPA